MSGLSLETCLSNLKSVALTILELLAFNAQKFRSSRDPGHVPFRKILRCHFRLSLETHLSSLKSLALTFLELVAFNAQKIRGSRYPGHAPFLKIFKGSCPDCRLKHARQLLSPSLALTVLELFVLNFHFKLV